MKKVLLGNVFSAKYLVDQRGIVYNLMQVNDDQISINTKKYCLEEMLEQITEEISINLYWQMKSPEEMRYGRLCTPKD